MTLTWDIVIGCVRKHNLKLSQRVLAYGVAITAHSRSHPDGDLRAVAVRGKGRLDNDARRVSAVEA